MGWRKVSEQTPQAPQVPIPPQTPKPVKIVEPSKPIEVWEVVLKIPTEEIRRVQREDGIIVNYITPEEVQLRKMTEEANNAWPI